MQIKWIFFDMGSTLIDEKVSDDLRITETLMQQGAPDEAEFRRVMAEHYRMNRDGYKCALADFGLNKVFWNCGYERLYPDCISVLAKLSDKYKLGIIANQPAGAESRLEQYGVRQYFDVVASSAEVGFAKPDEKIFLAALAQADCTPSECVMVGDRLDNDIAPAAALGMHTVWVRQGWGALGNVALLEHAPDITVENLTEMLKYF